MRKGECGPRTWKFESPWYGRKSEVQRVAIINYDLPNAYLGCNIVFIPEKLISIEMLVKIETEEGLYIIHSKIYIDKGTFVREIIMMTISATKFLYALTEWLKLRPT
jgi:hypothetical protein